MKRLMESVATWAPDTMNSMPVPEATSQNPDALRPGTSLLGGAYTVAAVLGSCGDGFLYRCHSEATHRVVLVQEYFPCGCMRNGHRVDAGGKWTPTRHAAGRERFLLDAAALGRVSGITVFATFEENNTTYMALAWPRAVSVEHAFDEPV